MRVIKTSAKFSDMFTRAGRMFRFVLLLVGGVVVALSPGNRGAIFAEVSAKNHPASRTDWPVYGGQSADDRYSALHQIDRTNVHKLKVAWTFDTKEPGGLQTNPLIVGRVLFGFTPTQKVIALDAATRTSL